MTPSPQQAAIFSFVRRGESNLIIDAKAGSGKTTTLVELLKCLPVRNPGELSPARIRFFAFNKLIADTLSARVPKNVVCSTFHSAGLSALKGSGQIDPALTRSRDWVDNGKCRKLVFNACGRDNPDLNHIIRLVSLTKTVAVLPSAINSGMLQDFAAAHSMSLENPHEAFSIVKSVAVKSFTNTDTIDFDDMLYLPVMLGCAFDWQDWVMCDEAQDTNDIQIEILDRMRRPSKVQCDDGNTHNFTIDREYDSAGTSVSCEHCGCQPEDGTSSTRFVFVGDPHQAIYAFRGANSDAMDKIGRRFDCESLPLSVSYRCSIAVIREAQKTVKDIEHRPDAPLGDVGTLNEYWPEIFQPGFAVLCRNTAPLVSHAYSMLSRDIPCIILGRDIGANLIAIVKKMRAANIEDLRQKLNVWSVREAKRAEAEQRSPESIYDQHTCLCYFIDSLDEDSQEVADVIAKIELMFTDDVTKKTGRVTLSTIHKAKGLEYPTVFILDRALIPSRYATTEAARRQERNLLYVAQTRAILNLYYINSDNWKQDSK